MSVRMMHLVFERFPLPGNDMVLALALADHAHDDGTNIFPGNERLAEKTRMSERTVIRLLKKFVDIGWLIKVKNSNSGRGYANVFCINPSWIKGEELKPEKGDNLSPFCEDVKGDKNIIRVTPQVKKGDIAVSPQPSLTINTTINTACAREIPADSKPKLTPQGEYACRLIKLGVSASSMHPTLCAWVQDKIPIDFIEQCVGIARQHKPEPEKIAPNYLDKIIRSELAPRVDNSWMNSDEGLRKKGIELGLPPKQGERWPDYKKRLIEADRRKGER